MVSELSLEDILDHIEKRLPLEAYDDERCFYLKIDDYVPVVATAIHDGHHLPDDLKLQCALSESERLYEEDPFTGRFIQESPITFIGQDSRYYYDLNRLPDEAIYDVAWGRSVWRVPLSETQRERALKRYERCYTVMHHLLSVLESSFQGETLLLFDIHSYNYKRWGREVPEINIGTSQISRNQWGKTLDRYLELLTEHFDSFWVAENNTFFGKGGFLGQLMHSHPQCLVLATEFKKYFCDEEHGEVFHEAVEDTRHKLAEVMRKMRLV